MKPIIFVIFLYILYIQISFYIIGSKFYESLERQFIVLWNSHYYTETINFLKKNKIMLIMFLNIMYFLNFGNIRSRFKKLLKDAEERKKFADELGIKGRDY